MKLSDELIKCEKHEMPEIIKKGDLIIITDEQKKKLIKNHPLTIESIFEACSRELKEFDNKNIQNTYEDLMQFE